MKALILGLLLLTMPFSAYAVDSKSIVNSLNRVDIVQVDNVSEVTSAIERIIKANPFNQSRRIDSKGIRDLAIVVAKVSYVTKVDWKLILSISYIESSLCHPRWLESNQGLRDWSVGCMQVNHRWWAKPVEGAGLSFNDLTETKAGMITGSLILKSKIKEFGWYEGIKRYNGIGKAADLYRHKVLSVYNIAYLTSPR